MRTSGNFFREQGIEIETEEQLDVLVREHAKNTFGNKGDFGNFTREHGSTDLLGNLICPIIDNICFLMQENRGILFNIRFLRVRFACKSSLNFYFNILL